MPEQTRPDGDGFEVTRVFEAPREDLWREWTEPQAFADWFGGPESEVPLDSVSMDVTPGGSWGATMFAGPGRREIQWKGTYLEVHEPERLVLTMADQPDADRRELITVTFKDLGDGRTEMTLEQRGWMGPEQYERAKQGWGGFLDRIAERLASA
jgi:uncharacterized protein YndB with AHSA1/START domain